LKRRCLLLALILVTLACQVIPTPPALEATPRRTATQPPLPPTPVTTFEGSVGATPSPGSVSEVISPGELPPFPAPAWAGLVPSQPTAWQSRPYQGVPLDLPIPLSEVANLAVTAGLTNLQRDFLSQNGFVVIQTREKQFADIRTPLSKVFGQPYYLTFDAAYQAFDLSLSELLRALEVEQLYPRLQALTQAVLNEVLSYPPVLQNDNLLDDVELAAAYLAVGLRLLDPQADLGLDPAVELRVQAQLAQIKSGGGVQESSLIPYLRDDFSVYRPTGHYAGDPQLEAYYQALTWFQRAKFRLVNADPRFVPSRAPLVITLALRRAPLGEGSAAQEWALVDDTLEYLLGPGDEVGPRQYSAMMDQLYGRQVSVLGLSDESLWFSFQGLNQAEPYLQVGTAFSPFLIGLKRDRSWGFLGSGFSLDDLILKSLVYDRVGSPDHRRTLPSGLDLAAALGSPAADEALQSSGATGYLNYSQQLDKLRSAVREQPEDGWTNSIYHSWLHLMSLQLSPLTGAYPPSMMSDAWNYWQLNSALAGWVTLKHETLLDSRVPQVVGQASDRPASGPAPAYLEPQPDLFYGLADLADRLTTGLAKLGLAGEPDQDPLSLSRSITNMAGLGDHFRKLGALAEKELEGAALSPEDYRLVLAPLGAVEQRALAGESPGLRVISAPQEMPLIPALSAIEGEGDQLLHVGTGLLNRIYVVVPLEGVLQVAQGGVYSYYEFPQLKLDRLTDTRWLQVLFSTQALDPPTWTGRFLFQKDGYPVDVLAFRVGDMYHITHAGGRLNLRDSPSFKATVLGQLPAGTYVMIVDGPVQAEGARWWKLSTDPAAPRQLEGWAIENPAWYERAWGQ
jgi:hypothetical protein